MWYMWYTWYSDPLLRPARSHPPQTVEHWWRSSRAGGREGGREGERERGGERGDGLTIVIFRSWRLCGVISPDSVTRLGASTLLLLLYPVYTSTKTFTGFDATRRYRRWRWTGPISARAINSLTKALKEPKIKSSYKAQTTRSLLKYFQVKYSTFKSMSAFGYF